MTGSSPARCPVVVTFYPYEEPSRPPVLCGEPLVRASEGPCETCDDGFSWDNAEEHIEFTTAVLHALQRINDEEPNGTPHPYQPPLVCPTHPLPESPPVPEVKP